MSLFPSRSRRAVDAIKEQLQEKRPLPVGRAEFHEWADRIIQGACLSATPDSQKFALTNIILNLGPTVAFESDHYFISCLRKSAANQVADVLREEIRNAVKTKLAKDTPPAGQDEKSMAETAV